MNSRTYSGVKPIEPIRCAYEPDKACTPTCKYYKTCIHSVHKKYECYLSGNNKINIFEREVKRCQKQQRQPWS